MPRVSTCPSGKGACPSCSSSFPQPLSSLKRHQNASIEYRSIPFYIPWISLASPSPSFLPFVQLTGFAKFTTKTIQMLKSVYDRAPEAMMRSLCLARSSRLQYVPESPCSQERGFTATPSLVKLPYTLTAHLQALFVICTLLSIEIESIDRYWLPRTKIKRKGNWLPCPLSIWCHSSSPRKWFSSALVYHS